MRSIVRQRCCAEPDPRHTYCCEKWAPAQQRTAEEALRCVRGTRPVVALHCINIVIASAAKQSRIFPQINFWIASLRSQ